MITLSLRTLVCNAAAVFSGCYGAVTRQTEQAGCSRQTVYEHARRVEPSSMTAVFCHVAAATILLGTEKVGRRRGRRAGGAKGDAQRDLRRVEPAALTLNQA